MEAAHNRDSRLRARSGRCSRQNRARPLAGHHSLAAIDTHSVGPHHTHSQPRSDTGRCTHHWDSGYRRHTFICCTNAVSTNGSTWQTGRFASIASFHLTGCGATILGHRVAIIAGLVWSDEAIAASADALTAVAALSCLARGDGLYPAKPPSKFFRRARLTQVRLTATSRVRVTPSAEE